MFEKASERDTILFQAKGFCNRLNDLWSISESDKRLTILNIIIKVATTTQADLLTLLYEFLDRVLSSSLVKILVDEHIIPLLMIPTTQTPINAEIIKELIKLILLGFETLPSKMDVYLTQIHSAIEVIKQTPEAFISNEGRANLERLEIAFKASNLFHLQ